MTAGAANMAETEERDFSGAVGKFKSSVIDDTPCFQFTVTTPLPLEKIYLVNLRESFAQQVVSVVMSGWVQGLQIDVYLDHTSPWPNFVRRVEYNQDPF
jgi:hypothetical protein